jgi:hypothetical protein
MLRKAGVPAALTTGNDNRSLSKGGKKQKKWKTNVEYNSNRSKIMKNRNFFRKVSSTMLGTALITTLAMGQNVVIGTAAATFTGAGTIKVAGNITNPSVATAVTINNPVTLNGAAAQAIGTSSNAAINFTTLNVTPSVVATTTLNVASTISTAVNIGSAGTAATLAVGTNTLTIGGTSALVNASSALSTASGSTVNYSSTAAGQAVLGGFTYNGNLTLSGGATKTLNAGTLTTVGQAFDASAAGAVTLSGTAFKLTTTGTFGVLSNSATISNGSGLTQFGAVTNTGTIDGTVGTGALTFNSTVGNNGGTIKGGAAAATFTGLLTQTGTGILTSGAGGLTLNAGLTNTLGNITVGASQSMSVSGGQFAYTAGTLTFDAASTVTYGSGATTIVDAPYGNLTLNTDAKTWALAAGRTVSGTLTLGSGAATTVSGSYDLTMGGNVALTANLTKSANAVVFTSASNAVTGTTNEIVGTVTRTHTFATATSYTFNSAATVVTPTAFTTLSSFSVASLKTDPTGYLGGNSVDRKYSTTFTGSGLTADVQLGYLTGDYTGGLTAKLKFFQGGIAKANKLGGTYTNGTTGSFKYVKLAALASLSSGSELGIDDRFNMFASIAAANWNVATTWDAGSIPTATDDVEIAPTFAVSIPTGYAAAAQGVTIDAGATGGLSLAGTATLAVGIDGITNNNTNTGLTLVSGTAVTITSGNLTNNGAITNAGTITVQ